MNFTIFVWNGNSFLVFVLKSSSFLWKHLLIFLSVSKMISFFKSSFSLLSNLLKLVGVSAIMLNSGVGELDFVSEWLVGEDNRSIWVAERGLGKTSWEKFKIYSVVMSTKPRFIQQESLFRFILFRTLSSEMRLFASSGRFPIVK